MSKVKRFSLEERYGYQNRKVIYDKKSDNDIELNNIYPIIDLLNQFDKQIADLEAKLAEKQKENATLEAMLVENANDRKTMQEFKIGEDEYDLTDEDARNSLCWEVEELKQQLAEKDKEIERLNLEFETQEDWQEKWQKLYDETCNLNQDKISFAIEQLEKVRDYFVEEDVDGDGLKTCDWTITKDACDVAEFIDQQINELKGNVEDVKENK